MKKLFISILLTACALHGFAAIHIHTDAADYRAGERMWFRIYFLDSDFLPDATVQMAVVELIEPEGVVTQRVKVMRIDDIFSGYIDIPSHAEAGQYLVRAYARGMEMNMQQAGKQVVYIHGKTSRVNRSDSVVLIGECKDSLSAPRERAKQTLNTLFSTSTPTNGIPIETTKCFVWGVTTPAESSTA